MSNPSLDTQFHAVYLLTSLDPKCQQSSYIGYTVEPERRLRQHNGELVSGAQRTRRRGRPWKMELCVLGFCNKHAALRFEWQWQHPHDASNSMRSRLNRIRRFIGFQHAYKARIAVLHELLHNDMWKNDTLMIHFFGASRIRYDSIVKEIREKILTVYQVPLQADPIHSKRGATVLKKYNSVLTTPSIVRIQSGDFRDVQRPLQAFESTLLAQPDDIFSIFTDSPVKTNSAQCSPVMSKSDNHCALCSNTMEEMHNMKCPACQSAVHILCLVNWFEANTPCTMNPCYSLYRELVPKHPAPCPSCLKETPWIDFVRTYKSQARTMAQEAAAQEKADYRARYALFRKEMQSK